MEKFLLDINTNYDKIIHEMELNPFKEVIY